ncbi:MAG: OadG family transporter subunit [Clostridia bacterium]
MVNLFLEIQQIDWMYAAMGMAIVFVVLALLVLYIKMQSIIMKIKKTSQQVEIAPLENQVNEKVDDELEVIAAITAALQIYYDTNNAIQTQTNTGFVVRKIRRV